MATIPESLIQLCETHPDRAFHVLREKKVNDQHTSSSDIQDQLPKWGIHTYSIQPYHPLAAWLWLHDTLYRVSPGALRQRIFLEATTEWQIRCSTIDFPRIYSRKKALEGFGSQRLDDIQAKSVLIAMERWMHDEPTLWILWNDEKKAISFVDEKAFPKASGYKHIWIIRETKWDRLWDASEWTSQALVLWLQEQEEIGFKVGWPMEPSSATLKSLAADYESLGFSGKGVSKDDLRLKVGRGKAIKTLVSLGMGHG